MRTITLAAGLAACIFIAFAPPGGAATADCTPTRGTLAAEVLRTCGEPRKRHAVRWRGTDIIHREWEYGETIVGLIDERVAYVFDLRSN